MRKEWQNWEKSLLGNPSSNNWFKQESSTDDEVWWKTKYLPSLKMVAQETQHSLQKGKTATSQWRIQWRWYLNQMFKVNVTSDGTDRQLGCHLTGYAEENTESFPGKFSHRWTESKTRKHQIHPNQRMRHKITGLHASKMPRSWKSEKDEDLFGIERKQRC